MVRAHEGARSPSHRTCGGRPTSHRRAHTPTRIPRHAREKRKANSPPHSTQSKSSLSASGRNHSADRKTRTTHRARYQAGPTKGVADNARAGLKRKSARPDRGTKSQPPAPSAQRQRGGDPYGDGHHGHINNMHMNVNAHTIDYFCVFDAHHQTATGGRSKPARFPTQSVMIL